MLIIYKLLSTPSIIVGAPKTAQKSTVPINQKSLRTHSRECLSCSNTPWMVKQSNVATVYSTGGFKRTAMWILTAILNTSATNLEQLWSLWRASSDILTLMHWKILYKSLVRSHLEFAASVWSPACVTHKRSLESTQKQFVMFLNNDYQNRAENDYVPAP